MGKDKKAKKDKGSKDAKADKKAKKSKAADQRNAPAEAVRKVTKNVVALAENPLVADVVAAALVAMAAALKDTKKAHQLAGDAEKELGALSGEAASHGHAMWDLARDIGRRTIEALASEQSSGRKRSKSA